VNFSNFLRTKEFSVCIFYFKKKANRDQLMGLEFSKQIKISFFLHFLLKRTFFAFLKNFVFSTSFSLNFFFSFFPLRSFFVKGCSLLQKEKIYHSFVYEWI
jgi:hypothetical protein